MWYELINSTDFLTRLYDDVPEIKMANIYEIRSHSLGGRIELVFELNNEVDNPPPKWKIQNDSIPVVHLSFSAIKQFKIDTNSEFYNSDITIEKKNELLIVKGTGSLNFEIHAESGMIQNIRGKKREIFFK